MMSTASRFAVGFGSLFAGLRMIAVNPRVRRHAMVPFALTAVVFVFGGAFGIIGIGSLVTGLVAQALGWMGFAAGSWAYAMAFWPMAAVVFVAAVFALSYLLFLLSRLIAMPFYSLLAERVLVEKGLMEAEEFRFGVWVKTNARMLKISVLKLFVFALLALILFVLSFLPVIGVAASFGFLMLGAFDVVDISLEALRFGFRERLRFFVDEFAAFVGLAAALGLVFLVPGLNFFLFPAAVVGASEVVRHGLDRRPKRGAQ